MSKSRLSVGGVGGMRAKAKHKDINEELFWKLDTETDEDARWDIIEEIVENNVRLVNFIIYKTFGTRGVHIICLKQKITPDDFVSSGMEGLYEAVSSFDIHRGVKFSTYATRPILNHVIKMFRKTGKSENDVSLDKPLYMDDSGKDMTLSDVMHEKVNPIEKFVDDTHNSMFLDKLSEILDDREKELLYLRFHLELSQTEIEKETGVSQVQVSRLLKRIMKKGRKLYFELEGA
jgi:RNA polymerase sporulation-specific sigma factor